MAVFFEYYIIHGVDHFILYNHSWSNDVEKIVSYYQKRGHVFVVPFQGNDNRMVMHKYDGTVERQVLKWTAYNSQLLVMHDCLYMMIGRTKYLAFIDFDEFIFIRKPRTSKILLDFLKTNDSPEIGAFHFQSSYVIHPWPSIKGGKNLRTQLSLTNSLNFDKIQRDYYVNYVHDRSKLIVKPGAVEMLNEHLIEQFVTKEYKERQVNPKKVLIFHEKQNMSEVKGFRSTFWLHDRSLKKFGRTALQKLRNITCTL